MGNVTGGESYAADIKTLANKGTFVALPDIQMGET